MYLNLTMSLAAFAGIGRDPAVLTGHGAITADLAAAIARSLATLSVHLLDADGHTAAVGGTTTTTYVPTRAITDQVLAAAGTCRFPSCRMPAYRCDLDHRVPYDHGNPDSGGRTEPDNLDPLCRHHHRLKTHAGWTADRDPLDGLTMVWTSPTGHAYTQRPPQHPMADFDAGGDRSRAPEHAVSTNHPRPGDFDHVDDQHPEPSGEHTCRSCVACAEAGPSILLRTRDVIERQAADFVERHRRRRHPPLLSPYASSSYRIGLNSVDTPDSSNPSDDSDEDASEIWNDPGYQPPTWIVAAGARLSGGPLPARRRH